MRIANWGAKEVFASIIETALDEAGNVMDDVTVVAKQKCPVLTNPKWERGEVRGLGLWKTNMWSHANVSFTPKTGRNKGNLVQFSTDKRWTGRKAGDLKSSIRKVTHTEKLGNIRVYAGQFKYYWAFMVEKGTVKTKAQPFLRPAFNGIRSKVVPRISDRISDFCSTV
jgi:HK97 gp10 family phage protein